MDKALGQRGGAAAVDEAAGTAELSSPWAWSPGACRRDDRVVSAVDLAVRQRGRVTAM